MILKRLAEILKSFSKDELKKFGRFIRSDYFNTNDRVTALFNELKKFYPSFDNPHIHAEYLFGKIYGLRKFDDKTMRYLSAELLGLAEKFIGITFFEHDPQKMNKGTIEGMIGRGMYSQAGRLIKNTTERLRKEFIIESEYLTDKIDYLQLWHQLLFLTNRQELQIENRIEHGEFLTLYNFMELCHLKSNLDTNESNYHIAYPDNIMNAFLKNLDYKKMLEYTNKISSPGGREGFINAFRIYLCYMITKNDEKDEVYFNKFRDLVFENGIYFEREALQNLYVMLTICINIKARAIDYEKYQRVYFNIINKALEQGLFTAYEGQFMDVFGYYRFFQTAIYLGEIKWAEGFAVSYLEKIAPEYREDLGNYTRAVLHFCNKHYEESLSYLSKTRFSFFRLKADVRRQMMMAYYELGYFIEANSLADSFAHFLSENKKLSPKMKTENLNFLSLSRELLKLKENKPVKSGLQKLRHKAENDGFLANKKWVLEKISELENIISRKK